MHYQTVLICYYDYFLCVIQSAIASPVAGSSGTALLARARYNNVAEAADELSFRQGDVVTVVKKDFNNQVDWWLCELRGKVGMVPANYLEVFHDHDMSAYDIPRPNSKGPRPSLSPQVTPNPSLSSSRPLSTDDDFPIYDLPPENAPDGPCDRDYDLPPPDGNASYETYDRPPSSTRLSPQGSNRSSLKSMNRISTASSAASSSGIYDLPPDPLDVYDFPKPSQPARGFEEDGENAPPNILQAVDISNVYDEEAEELLSSYRQWATSTYEALFNSVYGPEAYWGTDNKSRRSATLKSTIAAIRSFDRTLLVILQFGKGVVNRLEYVSDANFKKKYINAFKVLIHNRNDILGKVENLSSEIDSITGTVKSLLEIARTVPHAVTEFTVLVQANKAILFKPSVKMNGSLPVLTKTEVKSRPLPELPATMKLPRSSSDIDYAVPADSPHHHAHNDAMVKNGRVNSNNNQAGDSPQDYGGTVKRRPNDTLPPLPFATLPRNNKSDSSIHNHSVSNSPYHSRSGADVTLIRSNPTTMITTSGEDYDEIDKGPEGRDRSFAVTGGRPSLVSLGSSGSRGASPTHHRLRRQGSLSSCSSSDDVQSANLRRANSAEILDNPYGTPNHQRQHSSPQPLRMEERQILERFAKQFDLITPGLRDAIETLLVCLKDNEPPKDFVTKSKMTVVAAYKLVYIADALGQKIVHTETKTSIMSFSNSLTESIKSLVTATKTAALQYPSVIAHDKMADTLKQLFPSALDLINSVKSKTA